MKHTIDVELHLQWLFKAMQLWIDNDSLYGINSNPIIEINQMPLFTDMQTFILSPLLYFSCISPFDECSIKWGVCAVQTSEWQIQVMAPIPNKYLCRRA